MADEVRLLDANANEEDELRTFDASSWVYYGVEVLPTRRLHLGYFLWFLILLGATLLILAAPYEFDCVPFCNFGEVAGMCDPFQGIKSPPTCLPVEGNVWRSKGTFPPGFNSSSFRIYNRLVIITRTRMISPLPKEQFVTVSFYPQPRENESSSSSTGNTSSVAILDRQASVVYRSWETRNILTIGLPDDLTPLPAETAMMEVAFKENITSDDISQIFYLSESPIYTKGKMIVRYAIFGLGLLSAFYFLKLHAQRIAMTMTLTGQGTGRGFGETRNSPTLQEQGSSLLLLFRSSDYRSLTLEHRLVLLFHLMMVFSMDPLTYATKLFPSNNGLRYMTDHFFPLLRVCGLLGFSLSTYVVLGHLNVLGTSTVIVKSLLLISMFCVPMIVLDTYAAFESQRASPTAFRDNWESLGMFCIAYIWSFSCVGWFWVRRKRLVWNSGQLGFYSGRVRILVLWLRVVASFITVYVVFEAVVFIPVMIGNSYILPLSLTSRYLESVVAVALSTTALFLIAPRCYSPLEAPPNPHPVYFTSTLGRTGTQTASLRRSVVVDRVGKDTDLPPSGAEAAPLPRRRTGSRTSFSAASNTGKSIVDPTSVAGSAGGGYGTELTARTSLALRIGDDALQRSWKTMQWTTEMFEFIDRKNVSGFSFLTESEQQDFSKRHYLVKKSRGFFCWESAVACLNLSAEVYNDHEGEAILHHQEGGCCESCIARCMFPTREEEDEDEADRVNPLPPSDGGPNYRDSMVVSLAPTAVAQRRKMFASGKIILDVTSHGYELHQCIVVGGVQAIICTYDILPAVDLVASGDGRSFSDNGNSPLSGRPKTSTRRRVPHIALVFRGTANASNVVTDLNFVRTSYDEMMPDTGGLGRIHAGFSNVWCKLRPFLFQSLAALETKINDLKPSNPSPDDTTRSSPFPVPVYITGHSLGGALATLCHYSLVAGEGKPLASRLASSIYSYTFGCPRVGNQSFCSEFNRRCESYRIVRENDRITTVGICGREHAGREVVVDRDGNACVEPSTIEGTYNVLQGDGSSLRNHALERYASAFDACLVSFAGSVAAAEDLGFFTYLAANARGFTEAPTRSNKSRRGDITVSYS
jgi:hypothetical protein